MEKHFVSFKAIDKLNWVFLISLPAGGIVFWLLLIILLVTFRRRGERPKEAVKQQAKLGYKYSFLTVIFMPTKRQNVCFIVRKVLQTFFLSKKCSSQTISPLRLRSILVPLLEDES